VLGKDGKNQTCTQDLCKLIHTLVAGRSASGKSVFLNSVIMSLVYNHSPQDVRLILIDPKWVEFTSYQGLPHLILGRPITDFSESIGVLQWAITEMERRYTLFEKMCYEGAYVVNVDQYNEKLANEGDKLPKIVIIIDELADLMLADKRKVEETLHTLTQKARAAGIYLIVSTQRPSVDVLTGVIKANFMTRIAFSVASEIDSRVILDQAGAQSLLGRGDYLYSQPGKNELTRMQAPYVSEKEIASVVEYVKANWDSMQDDDVKEFLQKAKEKKVEVLEQELFEEEETRIRESYEELQRAIMEQWDPTPDPTCLEALKLVIEMKDPSISMVRRKCGLSYNEAGKIVEWMEDMGYISPFDGAKKRDVLITMKQFEAFYCGQEEEDGTSPESNEDKKPTDNDKTGKHRGYPPF
jgi:S-DNA-T family DNA segregation ATPase FtsK/SpoIIIE